MTDNIDIKNDIDNDNDYGTTITIGVTSPTVTITVAILKPDVIARNLQAQILDDLTASAFEIIRKESIQLTLEQAQDLYQEHASQPFYSGICQYISSAPVLLLALQKENAVESLRELVGPFEVINAPKFTLRGKYGIDFLRNSIYSSINPDTAKRNFAYFFEQLCPIRQRTLAIIKPDAIRGGYEGPILKQIFSEGFDVRRILRLKLSVSQAKEILAAYEFQDDFEDQVIHLSSGHITVLRLEHDYAVSRWRMLCGEVETDAGSVSERTSRASKSKATSIRARYGVDKIANAVHASDRQDTAANEIYTMFECISPLPTHTFAFIKPDAVASKYSEKIFARIEAAGFEIKRAERIHLTVDQAEFFYAEHKDREFYRDLVEFMTSGPAVALKLQRCNAVVTWRALCGPTNSIRARETDPNSIRALYGTDGRFNAVHGSDSDKSASRELALVFGDFFPIKERSVAILLPNILASKEKRNQIVSEISAEGFTVTHDRKFQFTIELATIFLRHLEGRRFLPKLVKLLCTDRVEVLVLERLNGIHHLRSLCGPKNSIKAKRIAPESFRARFGDDRVSNALLCSQTADEVDSFYNFFFRAHPEKVQRSIVIILPHVVAGGNSENVLNIFEENSDIKILETTSQTLNYEQASKFLIDEVGSLWYQTSIMMLCEGPAIIIRVEGSDVISTLESLAGPSDASIARHSHPTSIRGKFGRDRISNAIRFSSSEMRTNQHWNIFFSKQIKSEYEEEKVNEQASSCT